MRHTVALLRDISRVSLIVEMCSSGIENVPVDAWMLEQHYSMYAPEKVRSGGGGDCFDTHSVEHRDFKSDSTFIEVFVTFMNWTSRILI